MKIEFKKKLNFYNVFFFRFLKKIIKSAVNLFYS